VVGRLEKSCAKLAVGVALVLTGVSLAGCFSPNPTSPGPVIFQGLPAGTSVLRHTVQPGETISHIARLYGVSPVSLMAVNGVINPRRLEAGKTLIIPTTDHTATRAELFPWSSSRKSRQFAWPVTAGLVSSPFGIRNGVMHDGVDIVAPAGTAIHAADDGTVIFVGHLRGYGNAVILQHSGGYVTVYGHNERNLVRYGEQIVRGEIIAQLGSTGRATGPNLHFEVRFQGQPQNPLAYLPPPLPSSGISFARYSGS
jgi:murein DD-endopeptidase MepM/ murein hydrolase activator NlpD